MTSRGALIGRGRTAEIYEWGDGHVVKLFLPGIPENWLRREASTAQVVAAVCSYAPAFAGTVVIEEGGQARTGIVYEWVNGPILARAAMPRLWRVPRLAQEFARVHASIHDVTGPAIAALPRQQDQLRYDLANAPVSDAVKTAAIASLDALPRGVSLCHRDYHPENFVLSPRGPVILDWMTAGVGNPHGDVARTSLILTARNRPTGMGAFQAVVLDVLRGAFHRLYLRYYRQTRPLDLAEVAAWLPVLAVGRLREQVPGEEPHLRAMIVRAFRTE